MGLLEKALQYKKNINNQGEDTLIDRIKGPADTEIVNTEKTAEEYNKDQIIKSEDDDLINVSVKSEDEVNIGERIITNDKKTETEISADDDLFELPEADDVLPAEKLNSQKNFQENHISRPSSSEVQEKITEGAGFFGPDDEPVLMKTGAVKQENKNIQHNIEPAGVADQASKSIIADKESSEDKADEKSADSFTNVSGSPADSGEENESVSKNNFKISNENLPEENNEDFSDGNRRFSDIIILYEIEKDIISSETTEKLFDVILFSIMGQIGVSSTSIMLPSGKDRKWQLAESRGVEIDRSIIDFSSNEGILKKILNNNKITDIEDYNHDEFKDEYFKYISIDARILVPMIKDDIALGVIVLGNKITGEDYNDEDYEFIKSIAGLSARVLYNLSLNEEYVKQIEIFKKSSGVINEIEVLQDKILSSENIEGIKSEIKSYFHNLGIDSYGIFNRFENDATYKPVIVENEDFLLLEELDTNIKLTSKFSRYIFSLGNIVDINDFKKAEIVRDVFSESQINKMSHLRIYPFSIAKKSWGFISLFRIKQSADLNEIDSKMLKISKYIFSYINSVRDINFKENKYIDNIEILYKRIDDEIVNARSLGIPLTLVLFSIKNYKRYFNLYGFEEVKKLFESFEKIIKSRLGDGDFSVRYDRHKILIILPGKDKKFAVPLANSIRNELLSVYQQKEIQLLLTYLTAEYPEDGTNLYSLIDTID
jgi:GGDEF domain-containing protein